MPEWSEMSDAERAQWELLALGTSLNPNVRAWVGHILRAIEETKR